MFECSLKSHYPLLYDIASNKDIIVNQAIGYNKFYITFNRPLNIILQQLNLLYSQLTDITLTNSDDIIRWRWTNNGLFSTSSCYNWLDFGGIKANRFFCTWTTSLPLRIKIFLWLV
jgi:hypothetical protein